MGRAADRQEPWGEADRAALARAVAARDESQIECAARLRELGSPGATQSSVSKWVTGEIQKPRRPTVDAIRAYVAESERFVGGEADQARAASQDGAAFAAAVRDLADEPLLGPRQGAALDAVTERIRSGQPMSEADERVIHHQWQVLGLLGRTIVESPGLDPTSS